MFDVRNVRVGLYNGPVHLVVGDVDAVEPGGSALAEIRWEEVVGVVGLRDFSKLEVGADLSPGRGRWGSPAGRAVLGAFGEVEVAHEDGAHAVAHLEKGLELAVSEPHCG